MSSILGGISKALIIEPEDKYDRGQPITADSHIFDRAKVNIGHLYSVSFYFPDHFPEILMIVILPHLRLCNLTVYMTRIVYT